jgi:hypothetical protein
MNTASVLASEGVWVTVRSEECVRAQPDPYQHAPPMPSLTSAR